MSLRICALVTFVAGASNAIRQQAEDALRQAAEDIDEIDRSHAGLHLPGSVGGGDLTWDLLLPDQHALESLRQREKAGAGLRDALFGASPALATSVSALHAAALEVVSASVRHPETSGIKRTNFVRVLETAPRDRVAQWEREVPRLADHVPAIRNWSLSRVLDFLGDRPPTIWTHAWEQDFETVEGLNEDYMLSPYHWGHLDGWYDLEDPRCIMDPHLAHVYCPSRESVLAWIA